MVAASKKQKDGIGFRLQTKFLVGIIILQCLTMVCTILVVERKMRTTIEEEFLQLGTAISKNLSAVNASFVATYNYVGIEQNVSQAVKDNDLAYAMVQFFDGEVAAYSGDAGIKKEIARMTIDETVFDRNDHQVRTVDGGNRTGRICEIASPIIIGGTKWAAVRVGLSLEKIQLVIGDTRRLLFMLGMVALVLGCTASILFARRITRPVASLAREVEAISKGDYEQVLSIKTHDEIGFLAKRFGNMKESLKNHIQLLKNSNVELTNTNQRLQSLFKASQAMNSFRNQYRLYDLILDTAMMAVEAHGAALVMVEPEGSVQVVASIVKKTGDPVTRQIYQKLLTEQLLLGQLRSVDASLGACSYQLEYLENTPFFRISISAYPQLEIFSLPLGTADNITGYINLLRDQKGPLGISEMQTLIVLASQTTTSIENSHLLQQLEQAYFSSIRSLAKTLEFKDEYTQGHAERVAGVCKKIAKRMDMDKQSIKILYNAALLHDIGKIGVLEGILNKDSHLNNEEVRILKKHPVIGEEILRPIQSLDKERKIVRHHHEREDGQGYPDGLTGRQLSLSEKIIIVADAFDAMNSKRSYRVALESESIIEELKANRGKQFDRQVADVLIDIFRRETPQLPTPSGVIFLPTGSVQ
jgi:HD-GYP domain-containing protein (c-di-GMP phosphodiesterase class II)